MFNFLYDSDFLAPKYDSDQHLRSCVFDGNYDGCVEALRAGADPNSTNEEGNGAVHVAACYGKSKILRLLLDSGANPNLKGRGGQTPLHFSTRNKRPICVDTLLENAANPNVADSKGRTPLHCAAFSGSCETIVPLILGGAKIDQPSESEGMTPLHFAALKGRRLVLNILLDQGADPTQKDKNGKTPLDIAHKSVRSAFADKQVMSLRGSPRSSIVGAAATSGVLLTTKLTAAEERQNSSNSNEKSSSSSPSPSFKQGDKATYVKTGETITIMNVHTDDAEGPYYTVKFDKTGKIKQTIPSRMHSLL